MVRDSATIPSRFARCASGSVTRAGGGSRGGNGGCIGSGGWYVRRKSRSALPDELLQPLQPFPGRAEGLSIVLDAATEDLDRLVPAVHFGDLHLARSCSRNLLVAQEIVPQSIDDAPRRVGKVADGAVAEVLVEDGNHLVVRFVAVDHPQAAD